MPLNYRKIYEFVLVKLGFVRFRYVWLGLAGLVLVRLIQLQVWECYAIYIAKLL